MSIDLITPMILTFNEAPNIGRTLESLRWAKQILVIDSYSSDETLSIAQSYPAVKIVQRKFDNHADQCNFGLDQVDTPWVLSLDADYIVSTEFVAELKQLNYREDIAGYSTNFKYAVYGKTLRGTLYPPRTVLYRRDKAEYYNDGHTQRVRVAGKILSLQSYIYHDDRKDLGRWLQSQNKYMLLEVQKLQETPNHLLSRNDRIRKAKFLAPILVMLYCLFGKGIILDGWSGWYYVLQRTLAETLLALHLIENDIKLGLIEADGE